MSTETTTGTTTEATTTTTTTTTTTERHWTDPLRHIACASGIKDGRQYDTFADWWQKSKRGDHMLWLLEAVAYPDDRKLRLLACRCVRETRVDTTRTVWDLLTDERSRSAVEVAERYAVGEATDEELEAAAMEADRAAWAAARTAARAAARAARAAESVAERDTASAAARAARTAAWAAWTAAWAARTAAWAAWTAATKSARAQQANIIRELIPAEEVRGCWERYIAKEDKR